MKNAKIAFVLVLLTSVLCSCKAIEDVTQYAPVEHFPDDTILMSLENKKALNNPPELRLDTCSAMKVDACPIGCYKQCTNNVMNHPKCNCSDQKSFEVCSDNDMNDLLTMDEVLQNEAKDYGKYAIRVNKWNIGETEFNDPGNLHIQRTNPYVEEL